MSRPTRSDRRVYLPRDRDRGHRPWREDEKALARARRVERAPRSSAALWALEPRIVDDWHTYEADGFSCIGYAVLATDGFVWVRVVGEAGSMAAEAYFRERYGDAVAVQWLAPERDVERARAFGAWTAAGRILRVYSAIDRNGERRGSATVRSEDAAEIVVAVTCFVPLSPRRRVGGYKPQHHDIELAGPVAGRRVIDAATGRRRRSLAEIPFR